MTLRIDPAVLDDHARLAASLQKKQAAVEEAERAENYVRAGAARVDLMIFEILFCVEVA